MKNVLIGGRVWTRSESLKETLKILLSGFLMMLGLFLEWFLIH